MIYIMLLLFNHKKFFFKCKLPLFALIKLKGNNFTPYSLPLIWKINLVYKIKKRKNFEKRCGWSSVNGICFNKIKFLKLIPANLCIHYKQTFNNSRQDIKLSPWTFHAVLFLRWMVLTLKRVLHYTESSYSIV